VIAAHLSSKGGDDPLYGNQQPPVFHSAVDERIPQAEKTNQFIAEILGIKSEEPSLF
jgi:predicted extracellular nuclease